MQMDVARQHVPHDEPVPPATAASSTDYPIRAGQVLNPAGQAGVVEFVPSEDRSDREERVFGVHFDVAVPVALGPCAVLYLNGQHPAHRVDESTHA